MPDTARCPGCGAPAAADSATCEYCGAALATVNCPSCFAPMFVGSRFCTRCGAEVVRTETQDDTPMNCPRCNEPLHALQLGPTPVHECSACGGLWLDPATLQKLCDVRDEHAAVVSVLASRVPSSTVPTDTVRYIPCPRCKKLMNRVNFAHSSGVIVDVCKSDGVWLDRGELQRVLEFVEKGGLAAARERQKEQLIDEQHKLAAMQQRQGEMLVQGGGSFVNVRIGDSLGPRSPVEHVLMDALGLFLK
jgi:Zn-finger nucleic acid-binding protein